MQLSLRARLTAWYSVLLVLTVVGFSAAVLWLHWRLLIEQFDDGLESTAVTASRVVGAELAEEHDLGIAAGQMLSVVRARDTVVQVLDSAGTPVHAAPVGLPLRLELPPPGLRRVTRTLPGADGRPWRVTIASGTGDEHRFFVATGAPLDEAIEEWRTLLRACLVGIPLALVFAVGGGWWLGRHGLRPLTVMAAEARAITPTRLDGRLTVPTGAFELQQLADSFNRVLDRLGSALSTQRRFMADASHELRTPVSIMRTAADVTLSGPPRREDEYRDALSVIAQQASRLSRLVDDMMVLARADGGGYPMVMARLDLASLAGECVCDLSPYAVERGITVRCALEPVAVSGDEGLLRRLCANLLGNALTYTPAGGTVDVAVAAEGSRAVLRVADTGPGIPAADQARVFERFVRLDPARGAGGAGLGLAIVEWVASVHGGTVRIVSSSGAGTVVATDLPRLTGAQ